MRKFQSIVLISFMCFFFHGCDFWTGVSTPLPVRGPVDWKRVQPISPDAGGGIAFWISAEEFKGSRNGRMLRAWHNRVDRTLVLEASEPDETPTYQSKAANGLPSVKFDGRSHFEKEIEGSKILGKNTATVLLVMSEAEKQPLNDVFGWGDCVKNRFMAHLGGDSLHFHVGDPLIAGVSITAPLDWIGHFHVVALVRDQEVGKIEVDGRELAAAKMHPKLNMDQKSLLLVGNNACGNGTKGYISEMLIYNIALDSARLDSVTQYLASKYRIPLK